MKNKSFIFLLVLIFMCYSIGVCQAAQMVCIGLETQQQGICDIWDILELHEDDVDLTGQGYALFEIIQITNMTKAEVLVLLNDNKVARREICDPNGCILYWYWDAENPADKNWYEVKVHPDYTFTVQDFTQADIVILADDLATTSEKYMVLNKVKDKLILYPQNYEETLPKK